MLQAVTDDVLVAMHLKQQFKYCHYSIKDPQKCGYKSQGGPMPAIWKHFSQFYIISYHIIIYIALNTLSASQFKNLIKPIFAKSLLISLSE